jgi:hypothetical protein
VLKGKVTRYLEPSSPLYATGTIHRFILLKGNSRRLFIKSTAEMDADLLE